jgi:hypothetical protein
MSAPPLLNAAGRRRSPVHPARVSCRAPTAQQGSVLPARSAHGGGDRRGHAPSRRRRAGRPDAGFGRAAVAGGTAHRRSGSRSTTSSLVPDPCSCATVRAAAGARSAWTAGAGITSGPGSSCASGCRSVRCCAWSRGARVAGRGLPTPPARSCGASPRGPASDSGLPRTSCATPTPSSWRTRGCRSTSFSANWGIRTSVSLHLSAGDRQRRDHRHGPRPQGAHDPRQRRTPNLGRCTPASAAPVLVASTSSTVRPRACWSSRLACESPSWQPRLGRHDRIGGGADGRWVAVVAVQAACSACSTCSRLTL